MRGRHRSHRQQPELLAGPWGQTLVADKGYVSAEFEGRLADHGTELIPSRDEARATPTRCPSTPLAPPDHRVDQGHPQEPAQPRTSRRTQPQGVATRIVQRLLALTAAIWHNHHAGQPVLRSLTAYDH
jgi:hypothetical protein